MSRTDDDPGVLADLHAPAGAPGSGRLRYAAAMQLHRRGRLSAEALEVFRVCSPRDGADPLALLAERGLAAEMPPPRTPGATSTLTRLIDEIDRHLIGLDSLGIAETRAGIARWRGGPARAARAAESAVVRSHLASAVAVLGKTAPALADAIGMAAPHLCWTSYDAYHGEDIGAAFPSGHAYASLIGEGAVPAEDFDLGLLLIAPHLLYRDHAHAAPELYVPLTGPHGWRFAPDARLVVKPAHAPVWNPPGTPHLTKVGAVPFLAIYCWTRDVAEPARIVRARDWDRLERLRLDP